MKNTKYLFLAFAIIFCGVVSAQEEVKEEKSIPKFTLGLGLNSTSLRSGKTLAELVEPSHWNILQSVSSLSVGYNIGYGVSVNSSLNVAETGENENKKFLLNVDIKGRYDIGQFIGIDWLAPYVSLGLGYTSFDTEGSLNTGFGGGINFWVSDVFGVNIHSDYNHALSRNKIRDFYQTRLGVVFRL